jgi:hypothetical protein
MLSTAESQVANLAGVVHSITRATFAAVNSIFTEPAEDGLSNTRYGATFQFLAGCAHHPSLLVPAWRWSRPRGLATGAARFPATWGSGQLATIRAVPAAVLTLSGRVPYSPKCAAKRIGPTFGIRTAGSLNVAA